MYLRTSFDELGDEGTVEKAGKSSEKSCDRSCGRGGTVSEYEDIPAGIAMSTDWGEGRKGQER